MSPRPVPVPPRVLLIDAGHTWRGTQRQLLLLSVGLRERGVEPLVVAPPGTPLLKECKRAGIASVGRTMRAALDPLAVRGLRRLVAGWHPTLVHAHCPRSHALAMAALIGRRAQVPLVVTRRLATPPKGRLRHGARVARFIAITEAVRAALRAGGIADQRIALVHPGVRVPDGVTPRDWRAESGWPPEVVVAGVVGPLTESRHHGELERLLSAVDAATRRRLALVVLGGHGAGRATLADTRAYRAGFVHDVPAALAGLDLLLHPGGAEGLGTALVEGMALRIPAIAFAAGGVREILGDGVSGILVPAGDVDGFAMAVEQLVANPSRRRALGEAGPARAGEFSVPRMLDRTVAVYRDVTKGTAGVSLGG